MSVVNQFLYLFKKNDWALIVGVLFLVFFGMAAIYSVALGRGLGEFMNFNKQLIWFGVGLLLMIITANINYHFWQKISWLGYLASLILLVLVLTPLGSTIRGSRGWFSFGFFNFQPVELVKIFLIIVLADLCSRYSRTLHKFGQVVLIGLIVLFPFALVMAQPDFGSGMVLFFVWLIAFLLTSRNKWHVIIIFVSVIAMILSAWFFVFQDYQKARIMTFLDPSLDPLGRGYNVKQSIIAVGAGQFFGKGLGFGSQSQLKFIPESQTDFIFAVIAEELGFVGVLLLAALFGLLFWRFYKIAIRAPDDFGMFLALLVAGLIFVHIFINIGMCIGLLPVTGISLPFVSYGGSFLLIMMVLIGIIINVHKSSIISRRI